MKTIKFRAREIGGLKEWVYGYYVCVNLPCFGEEHRIYTGEFEEDNPDFPTYHIIDILTLGQLTGLKDKNGVEIYEGDILKLDFDELFSKIPAGFIGEVLFREYIYWVDNKNSAYLLWQEIATWEVIGNIHQNPELLK